VPWWWVGLGAVVGWTVNTELGEVPSLFLIIVPSREWKANGCDALDRRRKARGSADRRWWRRCAVGGQPTDCIPSGSGLSAGSGDGAEMSRNAPGVSGRSNQDAPALCTALVTPCAPSAGHADVRYAGGVKRWRGDGEYRVDEGQDAEQAGQGRPANRTGRAPERAAREPAPEVRALCCGLLPATFCLQSSAVLQRVRVSNRLFRPSSSSLNMRSFCDRSRILVTA